MARIIKWLLLSSAYSTQFGIPSMQSLSFKIKKEEKERKEKKEKKKGKKKHKKRKKKEKERGKGKEKKKKGENFKTFLLSPRSSQACTACCLFCALPCYVAIQ